MRANWIGLPIALLVTVGGPAAVAATVAAPVTIATAAGGSWRVTSSSTGTAVHRTEQASSPWSVALPGRWEVPVVTTRGQRAGPTVDGSAVVLAAPRGAQTSSFVVVRKGRFQGVQLDGAWAFDAVSRDGSRLYLIETVGRGRYWVRSADAVTGRVGDRIVAKSVGVSGVDVEDGPMEGRPIDRVASPDGLTVFTLYDGPEHPFVHALETETGGALCYDLPDSFKGSVAQLRLRQGVRDGLIDVVQGASVVVQIVEPTDLLGPSLRLAGTSLPPVVG